MATNDFLVSFDLELCSSTGHVTTKIRPGNINEAQSVGSTYYRSEKRS